MNKFIRINSDVKYRNTDHDIKMLVPIKNISKELKPLPKPTWMKIKLPIEYSRIQYIKKILREKGLNSVCEEASCPNIVNCFNHGTASFMILGVTCTRRCPFCDVSHGRPSALDKNEPKRLAEMIFDIGLRYVVVTSVNRDDLHDGGAQHFADCIQAIRFKNPNIKIEILVPDFRGCVETALNIIKTSLPDVFNHNLENVPRLYHQIRPGANYKLSLKLLERFKIENINLPTKSGLMVGLGETNEELIEVMHDLRAHGVTMLTLGQYLQPRNSSLVVKRYVTPKEFEYFKTIALSMGFTHVACGPFVRSSYHAELQAQGIEVK